MKIFYNKHGSLTIFMSLILTMVMIFTTVLIDGGRIILARNVVSGAGDMALNAGLTYYNSVLQDTYGLFAVSKNMDDLKENLEVYFEATLKSSGLHDQGLVKELVDIALSGSNGDEISDIMKMKLADGGFEVSQAAGANLSNANILRAQVLDYMKYRAPAVIGYGFLEKMNILKSLPAQQKALEDKKDYEKKLKEIQKLCISIYEHSREYEDYLIDGRFKTPMEIKTDVYLVGDDNFPYATMDAISYVQVNKLPKLGSDEYWLYNSGDALGGELKDDVSEFKNDISGLRSDFYSVTSSLVHNHIQKTPSGDASLEYDRFSDYIKYYNEYKTNVSRFHTVNARYIYSKQQYEKDKADIKSEIDSLIAASDDEHDYSNRITELENKSKALTDEWDRVEGWYKKSFKGNWSSTGENEVVPDNYGSSELSDEPYGPNFNINNLRDKYLDDLKNDIKLLATPQMRAAREYYVWFSE
ncbi:MAG: Tad domain-containing protein, partial [Lachnoanaerobaculum saburreum]